MAIDTQRHSLAPSFLAEQLEKAINQALQYAPGTQAALNKLAGKSVSLIANRPNIKLTLELCPGEIRISHYWEGSPTVSIKGPLISILFQLGLNKSPGELVASGIQVEGDQAFAQHLASVFQEMDLDLEEPLAHWVGDVAAHQVGQAARSAFSWFKKTASTLLDDGSHYLREEGRHVVEKSELNQFNQGIDSIRADFDRLEARIQRLQQKNTPNITLNSVDLRNTDNPFSPNK
jgi:ubiquinone biosynthesis protein UbiJ